MCLERLLAPDLHVFLGFHRIPRVKSLTLGRMSGGVRTKLQCHRKLFPSRQPVNLNLAVKDEPTHPALRLSRREIYGFTGQILKTLMFTKVDWIRRSKETITKFHSAHASGTIHASLRSSLYPLLSHGIKASNNIRCVEFERNKSPPKAENSFLFHGGTGQS